MSNDEPEFDTDLLGLQHELISELQEAGFAYFSDVTQVEVDLSNREMKVMIACDNKAIEPAIKKFAKENKFKSVTYSGDRGAYYLKR